MGVKSNIVIYYMVVIMGTTLFIVMDWAWQELIKVVVGLASTGIAYITVKEGSKGVKVLFTKKPVL